MYVHVAVALARVSDCGCPGTAPSASHPVAPQFGGLGLRWQPLGDEMVTPHGVRVSKGSMIKVAHRYSPTHAQCNEPPVFQARVPLLMPNAASWAVVFV